MDWNINMPESLIHVPAVDCSRLINVRICFSVRRLEDTYRERAEHPDVGRDKYRTERISPLQTGESAGNRYHP